MTCPRCAAAGLSSKDIRYSPGWVTLWRRHAKELVAKESKYDDMLSHWGWSKLVNMIPDESYWSMLAQHLGHKITGDLTTYMEPGDAKTGHSKMFTDQDVPRLWAQPKPSFFARKFATTPKNDRALAAPIAKARGLEAKGGGGGGGAGRRASSKAAAAAKESGGGEVEAAAGEEKGGGGAVQLMKRIESKLIKRIESMEAKIDTLLQSKGIKSAAEA